MGGGGEQRDGDWTRGPGLWIWGLGLFISSHPQGSTGPFGRGGDLKPEQSSTCLRFSFQRGEVQSEGRPTSDPFRVFDSTGRGSCPDGSGPVLTTTREDVRLHPSPPPVRTPRSSLLDPDTGGFSSSTLHSLPRPPMVPYSDSSVFGFSRKWGR